VYGYQLAPGNIRNLEKVASQFDSEKGIRVLSHANSTLEGMPSVRIICQVTGGDGTKTFGRYECVASGPYYYTLYVGDPEQSFVEGETADAFFNSVRFPEQ
jgi:hypothetical protein